MENGIFLDKRPWVLNNQDALVDIVENSVLKDAAVRLIFDTYACFLIFANFNILKYLGVVVFASDHHSIFNAAFDRVELDLGLVDVRVECFAYDPTLTVSDEVSYDRRIAWHCVDSMDDIFNLIIEYPRSSSKAYFDPVFLHIISNTLDDVFFYEALIFESSDLNMRSLVFVESVFRHDNYRFLGCIDDYASFEMPMDLAGIDQHISFFDEKTYCWVYRISSDEAVFEDALWLRLEDNSGDCRLNISLQKIEAHNAFLLD